LALRTLVGPTELEYDNPNHTPVYAGYGLPLSAYDAVFDFGCGCGRIARQLMLQEPPPRRYVGVDIHQGMIDWCQENLTPADPNFRFFHHDVYAPAYAPRNTLQLAQPFPVGDGEFSLVIAHSVFTHLYRTQTEFYLREVARILRPDGTAFTSWFFFDREAFPFLHEGPYSLFVSEVDPTQAVIYDREWFVDAVHQAGLTITSTTLPPIAGQQWIVFLSRTEGPDRFPMGEDGAEWLCGATTKPRAQTELDAQSIQRTKVAGIGFPSTSSWPTPPPLFGVLAELAAARRPLRKRQLLRHLLGSMLKRRRT